MTSNKRESNYIVYEIGGKNYTRKEIQSGKLGDTKKIDWEKVGKTLDKGVELEEWEDKPRVNKVKLTNKIIKEAIVKTKGIKLANGKDYKINEYDMEFLNKNIAMPILVNEVTIKPGNELFKEAIKMLKEEKENEIILKGIKDGTVVKTGDISIVSEEVTDWADENVGEIIEAIQIKYSYGIPAVGSTSSQLNKTYQPTYQAMPLDDVLYQTLFNTLRYGKFPAIEGLEETEVHDRLVDFYNDLRITSENYYCGTSGPRAQLGRYQAVLAVSKHRKELPLTYEQYKKFQNQLNPLKPAALARLDTVSISEVEDSYFQQYNKPLNKVNMVANGGIIWNPGTLRGMILTQDWMLASDMLSSIGTPKYAKYSGWAGIAEFKAKVEVYKRSELHTKNRNYMPFNSFAMLPAMTLYNLVHHDPPKYGEDDCIVMNNFSVFNGNFHDFLIMMIDRAKKRTITFAVYADNLYIAQLEGESIYFYSLDGVKFEASSTRKLIEFENRRQIESLKEAGVKVDKRWEAYYIEVFPEWVVDGICQWGPSQFRFKQMASGTVGTFAYNTALMVCLVQAFQSSDKAILSEGKFTKNGMNIMEQMGIQLTIEKFVNLTEERPRLTVAPFDILGFDGMYFHTEGTNNVWVPVLNEQRLLNAQVFYKDSKQKNEAKQALVDFSRHYAFYVLGNWADPARSFINMKCMTRALKDFIGSGLSGKKATQYIKNLIDELGEDDINMQIAALLEQFIINEELPVITIPHLFGLLTGFQDKDVVDFLKKNKITETGIWTTRVNNKKRQRLVVKIDRFVPFTYILTKMDPEPEKLLKYTLKTKYENLKIAKKDKPKPRELTTSDTIDFLKWVKQINSRAVTYNVVPYIPEEHRETNTVLNLDLLWANFTSQIAGTFRLPKKTVRAHTKLLQRNFVLYPNPEIHKGIESNTTEGPMTGTVYLFPSYSHRLYMGFNIKNITIDYQYYISRGLTKDFVIDCVKNNKVINVEQLPQPANRKREKLLVEQVQPAWITKVIQPKEEKPKLVYKPVNPQTDSLPIAPTTTSSVIVEKKITKTRPMKKLIKLKQNVIIPKFIERRKIIGEDDFNSAVLMFENNRVDDQLMKRIMKNLNDAGDMTSWLTTSYTAYRSLVLE